MWELFFSLWGVCVLNFDVKDKNRVYRKWWDVSCEQYVEKTDSSSASIQTHNNTYIQQTLEHAYTTKTHNNVNTQQNKCITMHTHNKTKTKYTTNTQQNKYTTNTTK